MRGYGCPIVLLLAVAASHLAGAPTAAVVPRAACFPVEALGPELGAASEALLLVALDSEALFTIFTGLKPVSGGFATFFPDMHGAMDEAAVRRTEQLMTAWHCGGALAAGVYVFDRPDDQGARYADAIVGHVDAVARLRARHASFFAEYGWREPVSPIEVALAVEHDASRMRRWRGYGYLFGYPDYAVDFFVRAEAQRASTGTPVPRDFVSVPIYGGVRDRFAWAVEKGHVENDEDRRIRDRAAAVLASYERLRRRYISPEGRGAVALVRDVFCGADGCSAAHAAQLLR